MQNPTVVLGGLGGGGDVGLALMLARLAGIDLGRVVVASFLKCSVERDRLGRLRVEGALIEIPEGFFAERRHFEDKLPRLFPELRGRVYGICVFSPWRDVEAAIDYLLDEYRPGCSLHTDLGGDAALQGYEEKLGSYDTDALAKAALAWASEERGLNSIIAVGCPGCEGGGEWLDQAELAAMLLYLDKLGAIRGVIHPPPTEAWVIEELLRHADSGMLPLYHAALQGLSRAEVRRAYLSGVYEVKPWYPKVILLDPASSCRASPLCSQLIGRGEPALRALAKRKPQPPKEWLALLDWVKRNGPDKAYQRLERRKASVKRLAKACAERRAAEGKAV